MNLNTLKIVVACLLVLYTIDDCAGLNCKFNSSSRELIKKDVSLFISIYYEGLIVKRKSGEMPVQTPIKPVLIVDERMLSSGMTDSYNKSIHVGDKFVATKTYWYTDGENVYVSYPFMYSNDSQQIAMSSECKQKIHPLNGTATMTVRVSQYFKISGNTSEHETREFKFIFSNQTIITPPPSANTTPSAGVSVQSALSLWMSFFTLAMFANSQMF